MKKFLLTGICLALVFYVYGQEKKNFAQEGDKVYKPKYSLFYENHTMFTFPDMGKNFDAEAFTDRIKRCGVDFMTFHARCNQGLAYYDTKVGIKHPSLKYDLFGKLAEACQRKGIALIAYLNAGISNEEGLLHREWTSLFFDGKEFVEYPNSPFPDQGYVRRMMCYNTPYRDHLISMVKEVAQNYPVSGFFFDYGGGGCTCICPYCIKEMKERGIDWTKG